MVDYQLHSLERPGEELREAVLRPLRDYNERFGGPANYTRVAILLIDGSDRSPVGGLWGHHSYDWLFVELLAVPDGLRGRGFGRALLAEAERQAAVRSAVGVWLDTFSFQARGFYEKLGYTLFGELPDHPQGGARFFLQKRLDR